ncbi:MAG: hypothetical protein OEM05_11895 [Myxococcales bacterium]|nr:hypothetical protein [Myxococcales bacterium]
MSNNPPPDSAFDEVAAGSFSANACTPVIDEFDVDYRGLKIHAPTRVQFPAGSETPRIVVCGTGVFDWNYMDLDGDFLEAIVIVAVNDQTHESRSGRMQIIENRAMGPPVREKLGLSKEDFKNRSIQKHFNPDIGALLELPATPGSYTVYATLGQYKSNVVQIRLETRSGN